ncbi:MAG: TonB-dependent receptor [Rhodospirillaceae bacterium]|nr:TonB-dependent receptor [Rhodospirillaceae bacterium]
MNSRTRFNALMASAALAALTSPVALAQDPSAEKADRIEEIVVTGSRIVRDSFSSALPVSVVTAASIRESGSTSIGDILLDQTIINPATNNQNSSGTLFLAGQTRADIRGLGPTRTLVLMDGRRLPFTDASSPAVDLNIVPSLMIDRIETIAGGASAVYGSEAIAGVVNIIMKKEQEGFEVDAQTGITQRGDGEEIRAGFNWGRKFAGDKLNVLLGGEYASQDTIFQKDRSAFARGIRRDIRVTPQPILDPTSRSNTSPYATFQLIGGALGVARSVTRDVRDGGISIVRLSRECSTAVVQPDCQDPSLFYAAEYNVLQGEFDRTVLRGYADYDLDNNWKLTFDAIYGRGTGGGIFQPAFSNAAGGGTMPVVLRGDNAFLAGNTPTATQLRAEWLAAGKTFTQGSTAQVGKFWQEFGGRNVDGTRKLWKITPGFNGKIEAFDRSFNVDGYAQYSRVAGETISVNVPQILRVQQATDAVLLNGQIVCRDATARANGCVPWDLLGQPSREAIAWTNAQSTTDQVVKQTVAGVSVAGDVFDLPAGPVGAAVGVEYRKEESSFVQDPLGASGALFFNSVGTRAGDYNVKEAFGEIAIPLLSDVTMAKDLSVEVAGRVSDYSSIGSTDQRRYNLQWAPVEDVRFRATDSTAVRAPNIVELFAPQSRNFSNVAIDPCDRDAFRGATAAQQAARRITCGAAIANYNPLTFQSNFGPGRPSLPLLQGGNPGLGPEKAHTYQYGLVIQPRWISNLSMSVDFFRYTITDSVGTIPINTLLSNLCHDDASRPFASNQFCAQIRRDATGTQGGAVPGGAIEVILTNQNIASTKVEGWDYSIAYGFRTEDVFGSDYGTIALRLDATWMYEFNQQGLPGQAYVQFANTITNATPEWKANASVRWEYEDLALQWNTLYIGSMIASQTQQLGVLNPFKTGKYYRHDARATYQVNDSIVVRGGINNLFDENPPRLPETFTGTGTGSSQYDNRGRFFYIGANATF